MACVAALTLGLSTTGPVAGAGTSADSGSSTVSTFELGPVAGSEAFTLVLSTRAADGASGLGDGATG